MPTIQQLVRKGRFSAPNRSKSATDYEKTSTDCGKPAQVHDHGELTYYALTWDCPSLRLMNIGLTIRMESAQVPLEYVNCKLSQIDKEVKPETYRAFERIQKEYIQPKLMHKGMVLS